MKQTVIVVIVAAVLIGGFIFFRSESGADVAGASTVKFEDPISGLKFDYPNVYEKAQDSSNDIISLTSEDPSSRVSIQTESGESINKLAIVGKPLNELLLSSGKSRTAKTYPGYESVSENIKTINGIDAAEIVFEYEGQGSVVVRQKLLILTPNTSTAVYIAMQSPSTDYELADDNLFQLIIESIQF